MKNSPVYKYFCKIYMHLEQIYMHFYGVSRGCNGRVSRLEIFFSLTGVILDKFYQKKPPCVYFFGVTPLIFINSPVYTDLQSVSMPLMCLFCLQNRKIYFLMNILVLLSAALTKQQLYRLSFLYLSHLLPNLLTYRAMFNMSKNDDLIQMSN